LRRYRFDRCGSIFNAWVSDGFPTAPEGSVAASARPGQYYFELGVAAVRNRD